MEVVKVTGPKPRTRRIVELAEEAGEKIERTKRAGDHPEKNGESTEEKTKIRQKIKIR